MHQFEIQVFNFIRRHCLVTRGDRVVVAVSGGADSVSLLYALQKVSPEFGVTLHIAHLDHRLRGEASSNDAEYVRLLAERLGVPATIDSRDVQGYRQAHRLSLEEAAREVRYQFLESVVQDTGAAAVAVAHTNDDHVETVLLHLLRGAGLTGLVGLKEASTLQYKRVGPLRVIRPLLCRSRVEVEAYCRETKLDFCTDVTNKSLSSTRNRIRLKLLPILKQDYNPQINDALDRLSKLAAEEVGFIEAEANREAALLVTVRNDLITIDRQALLKLHPALRRVVLRQLLVNALNSSKDVESVHVEAMMELAEGRPGRSIDLPDGLGFAAGYGELQLGRDLSQAIPLPVLDGQHRLNIPGVTVLGGWRVTATIDEASESTLDSQGIDPLVAVMDWETAGSELRVRCREAGDSFRPLGLDGDKKLKDFFIDEKVPRLWRDRVPVVVNPVHIVWVAGYRLDDRVKINPATRRLLRLEFTLPSTQKQISLVRPESPG